jgi:large subunit ribosomal protein L30
MTANAKKTPKAPKGAQPAAGGRTIKVTLVRSLIGYPPVQRETAKGLGLRKLGSSAVLVETPAVLGMVNRIVHAVKVETVEKP